jgi:hypothetical protein
VQKNGKRIHRFSWFELEDIETKLLIKIDDFKFFSKILKKEFKEIDNPNIAVELYHIFLILVDEIKSSVILSNIENLERFKGDFCSGLNKTEMKELSAVLHLPQYSKKKKNYRLNF